jgi:hypothetical protein
MGLRAHGQSRTAWNSLISTASRYEGPCARPVRTRRMRWWIRTCAVLSVIAIRELAHAVRYRWWPVLVGIVLTVIGVTIRGGPASVVLLPGLLLLLSAPLVLPSLGDGRARRGALARELAAYSTRAQRVDLEIMLDRYPDDITYELRDILGAQPMVGGRNKVPGSGAC